jgi:hypothetical protein
MGEWLLSRRDSKIVARHEVPWNDEENSRDSSGTIEPIIGPELFNRFWCFRNGISIRRAVACSCRG